MKACVVLGLSCLIFVGCASARSVHYARATQYSPTDPSTIQIYNVEPAEPYERLGEIYYGGMNIASSSGARKLIREQAAAMGADAVIVVERGASWVAQPTYGKGMFALAIKFKQKSATASPSLALAEVAAQFTGVSTGQPATTSPSVAPAIVDGSTPQAAPSQPSAFDQAYQAGMIAIVSKDFKAAIESFHNAVMLDNSSVLAWTGLGVAHDRSRDFSDAMHCYQAALNLNPTNAAALAGLADVYGQIGETNKYVETLEKVRQISPVVAAAVAEFVKEQNAQPGAGVTPKGNGRGF